MAIIVNITNIFQFEVVLVVHFSFQRQSLNCAVILKQKQAK